MMILEAGIPARKKKAIAPKEADTTLFTIFLSSGIMPFDILLNKTAVIGGIINATHFP